MISTILNKMKDYVISQKNRAVAFVKSIPRKSWEALKASPGFAYRLAKKSIKWIIFYIFNSIVRTIFTVRAAIGDAARILLTISFVAAVAVPSVFFVMEFSKMPRALVTDDLPPIKVSENVFSKDELKFDPIVRLHTKQGRFFCSGSVISDNYILTAAHCVSSLDPGFDKDNIQIRNSRNQNVGVNAETVFYQSDLDVAILKGNFYMFNKLPVALSPDEALSPYGPYTTCGYPRGDRMLCNEFKPMGPFGFFIGGKGYMYRGMSGGPLIDARGVIIGVNSMVVNDVAVVAPLIGVFNNAGIKIKP